MNFKPSFSLFLLLILLLLAFACPAQTNNIRPAASALMVNSNGVLVSPTNFFTTNAAALNAAVTGGGASTNALTNNATSVTLSGAFIGTHSGNGAGLTNLAATNLTGTIPAARFGGFSYTTNISSSAQTFINAPHGLGVTPLIVRCVLVCVTNDASTGYVVGDEVDAASVTYNTTDGNYNFGAAAFAWGANATNVFVSTFETLGGDESSFSVNAKAGSGIAGGTPSNPSSFNNFKIKIYARP